MAKKYFIKEFLSFFEELKSHNSKEWFDENRSRYENDVKKPFDELIKDLLLKVGEVKSEINLTHGKCIFRINRDVRFSKDKTLYKTNRSAFISQYGTKNKSYPGMYFEINTDIVNIYGGLYMLDAKQIQRVREEIMDYHDDFAKVLNDKKFKSTFGSVQGEKAKRIPKEFADFEKKEELINNKNWYIYRKLPVDVILKDDFLDVLIEHFKIMKPYNEFFERPIADLLN